MATAFFTNSQGSGIGGNLTRYNFLMQCSNSWSAAESVRVSIITSDATFSHLNVYYATNTLTVDSSYVVRKNFSNVTSNITVPAGVIGHFEDDINTDAFSAGDIATLRLSTPSGSGSSAPVVTGGAWTTAGPEMIQFIGAGKAGSLSAASTQYYSPIVGRSSWSTFAVFPVTITSETTLRNFSYYASSNSRTSDSVLAPRINGVISATQIITVPAGVIGIFTNSTDETALVPGDTIDWSFLTGAGAGSISQGTVQAEFVTTDDSWQTYTASTTGQSTTHGLTRWYPVGGDLQVSSFITNYPGSVTRDCVAKHIQAYLSANTSITDGTTTLLKDDVATAATMTMPAGVLGYFESDISIDFAQWQTAQFEHTLPAGSGQNTFINVGIRWEPPAPAAEPEGGHFIPESGPVLSEKEYRKLQRKLAGLRDKVEEIKSPETEDFDETLKALEAEEAKLARIKPLAKEAADTLQSLISSAYYIENKESITPLVRELEELLILISNKEEMLQADEEDVLTIIMLLH